MQAHRRLQRVVDDLVHVTRREHPLRPGRRAPARRVCVRSVSSPVQDGQHARGAAVVVRPAALAGHPGQQPHLVAGAGAQPVVPAGRRVVADQVVPLGAVGGDRSGPGRRTRPRWPGARAGAAGGAGLRGCRRRSGGRCRCSWVRWFLGREGGEVGGLLGVADRPPGSRVEQACPGVGRRETAAESRWTQRVQPERVGLNSWNDDNSYSGRGQRRGTRRSAVEVSAKCREHAHKDDRFTPALSTRRPGMWGMVHLIRFIVRGERFVHVR